MGKSYDFKKKIDKESAREYFKNYVKENYGTRHYSFDDDVEQTTENSDRYRLAEYVASEWNPKKRITEDYAKKYHQSFMNGYVPNVTGAYNDKVFENVVKLNRQKTNGEDYKQSLNYKSDTTGTNYLNRKNQLNPYTSKKSKNGIPGAASDQDFNLMLSGYHDIVSNPTKYSSKDYDKEIDWLNNQRSDLKKLVDEYQFRVGNWKFSVGEDSKQYKDADKTLQTLEQQYHDIANAILDLKSAKENPKAYSSGNEKNKNAMPGFYQNNPFPSNTSVNSVLPSISKKEIFSEIPGQSNNSKDLSSLVYPNLSSDASLQETIAKIRQGGQGNRSAVLDSISNQWSEKNRDNYLTQIADDMEQGDKEKFYRDWELYHNNHDSFWLEKDKMKARERERNLDELSFVQYRSDFNQYSDKGKQKQKETGYINEPELYDEFSDTEKKIYDYHIGKDDKESADAYYELMNEELKRRAGQIKSLELTNDHGAAYRTVFSAATSLGNSVSSLGQAGKRLLLNDTDPIGKSVNQYAHEYMRPELGGVEGVVNDLAYTTANMAPSIAASMIHPGLGIMTIGVQSGGNTYNESRLEGYSDRDALNYAAVSGSAEALTQYALGGLKYLGKSGASKAFSKIFENNDSYKTLSNELNGIFAKLVKNPSVRNTLKKIGTRLGDMNSEGVEEYVQEILDPVFRNITLGENNEFELINGDALYSYLLGALSAGVMNAPFNVNEDAGIRNLGKEIKQRGETQNLIDSALSSDPSGKSWELAQEISNKQQKGKKLSNYDVGQLYQTMQEENITLDQVETIPETSDIVPNSDVDEELQLNQNKKTEADYPLRGSKAVNPNGNTMGSASPDINVSQNNTGVNNRISQNNRNSVSKDAVAEWIGSDTPVTTAGVSKVENGELYVNVKTNNGTETVKSSDLTFQNPNVEKAFQAAAQFDTNGAKAFLSGYHSDADFDTYYNGFVRAYDAGVSNVPYEMINSVYVSAIAPESAMNAYFAGVNDAKGRFTVGQENATIGTTGLSNVRTTKTVKRTDNATYTYQSVNPESYSKCASEVKADFDRWGIESDVVQGEIEVTNSKGETRIYNRTDSGYSDEAATIEDGGMLISNDIDPVMDHREYSAHELLHRLLKLKSKEARAFYDSVTDGNINFASEEFNQFVERIVDNYFNKDVDILTALESDLFKNEFSAFVSGALYKNDVEEISRFSSMFYDWDSVENSWLDMMETVEGDIRNVREQENGRSGDEENFRERRQVLWARSEGSPADVSRTPTGIERSAENTTRETTGTPSQETRSRAKGQTGLIQNDVSKKLKGYERVYLHALGKVFNTGIVIDETIEGKKGNGYYDYDTGLIHIARDATGEAYDFVLKHEFTHRMQEKSPKLYQDYFDYVVSYLNKTDAKTFDRLVQAQIDGYRQIGKNISRIEAMDEVVADASDAFLRNSSEIKELVNQNRSLGERIREMIRSMIAKIDRYLKSHRDLNSDAAAMLMKDKQAWQEAERLWTRALLDTVNNKNTVQQDSSTDDVRYSIRYTTDNKPVAVIDKDVLDGVPKSKWVQTVKDTISNKFSEGIPISGRLIKVNSISRSEFTNSKYSKYLRSSDGTIYQDKFRSANNFDDIVLASTNYINEDLKHQRKDNFREFARGDVLIRVGKNDYSAKVIVGFTSGKQMVLYDIVNFVQTSLDIKNKDNSIDFGKNRNLRNELSSNTNVSQKDTGVNSIISKNDGNDTPKQFSLKNVSKLDYESLTAKPDMKVTRLIDDVPLRDDGKIDRTEVINRGLQSLNGKDNGKNVSGRHYVYVDDIGEYVSVNRKAIEHGLSRKADSTAKVSLQLGDILQNAIYINELTPRNENILSSYVLLGVARDFDGAVYPVRFVVNQYSDTEAEISQMEVLNALYSAKAKKIESVANASATISKNANVPSDSTISISDLLDTVKDAYPDILPQSVLDHYGIGRGKGGLSDSVKFSLKNVSKLESEITIDRYTEKEYNDYGWAAVNEVLSPSELRKLNTQFADILHGEQFQKSADGYYVIPVGPENKPQNSFVFIKGTISHPEIAQIIRIDVKNETELDIIRGEFKNGNSFYARKIVEDIYGEEVSYAVYQASDFSSYREIKTKIQSLRRDARRDQRLSDRGRNQGSDLESLQNQDQVKFSLKNVSKLDYDRVVKENKKQKEMIAFLKDQFKVTKGIKWDKKSIQQTANRILKQYDSNYSAEDFTENLNRIYTYVANSPVVDAEEVHSVVTAMAKSVLEHSQTLDDTMYREYKGLRDRLRETRIKLPDAYHSDVNGGYEAFRRANLGRIRLANDGMSVDVFYQELADSYPEFFAYDNIVHPADQLTRIAEVLDTLKPVYVNPFGMNLDESASVLANEIMEAYFEIPQAKPTYADKQLQKQKMLKLEYQKKIREIKAEYRAKYEEKLKEVNRQNILKIQKVREELKKASAADKAQIAKLKAQIERLTQYNSNVSNARSVALASSSSKKISSPVKQSGQISHNAVVSLDMDSDLAKEIATSKKSASVIIKEHLIRKYGGTEITFSDGRKAVMDNSDAKEMAQHAGPVKVAEISQLEAIIKKAVLQEETDVEHPKFTRFYYYAVTIEYDTSNGKQSKPILLNVGHGKFDGKNHLYAITDKKRNSAGQLDLSRPVGTLINNAVSNNSIPQSGTKINMSDNPLYRNAVEQYGAISKGENPIRDVDVPKQTTEDTKVRQFARTAMEAKATPDEMVSEFEREIMDGTFNYNPIEDNTAQKEADTVINHKGFDGALRQWRSVLNNKNSASKNDIVLAEKLYMQAAKNGDYRLAMELAAEIAEEGTRSGQNVQAFRLLKKMSGEGQLVYNERVVDRLNQDLEKRREHGKAEYVEIPQQLKQELLNAKTPEEIDAANQKIYEDLAKQLPPTFADKWNAWRYLAMLGNPRTHVRNVLGNAVFMPTVKLKNLIATGLEAAYQYAGTKTERTKTLNIGKEYKEFAKNDFKQMMDIISGGGKMNPEDIIRDHRRIFRFEPLEKLRKLNSELLEKEDRFFLKRYYINALAGYLSVNHVDLNSVESIAVMERARNYAISEAQKATYRDASAVASAIQRIAHTNAATEFLVEGVLPFKKTPINILRRGVEYSPAGLIYALSVGTRNVKTGKITATQYIDSVSAGLSGSALFVLGAFLNSIGFLRPGGDDEEKKDRFEQNMGYQPYSLQIGNFSYTIDWMAPSVLPLFVGSEVFRTLSKEREGFSVSDFVDDTKKLADPIIEMSMLSGLQNILESISYGDNGLGSIAMNTITGYFGQANPTVLGQVARTIDDTRRTTYMDKNIKVPSDFQKFFQKNMNKIPFVSKLSQPYIDLWGREETQGNILERALQNFVSPGYSSNTSDAERAVEKEITRLYEAVGDKSVFPSTAPKYFMVNKVRKDLTAEEYTKFAKAKGQKAYHLMEQLIQSAGYRSLSDEEKAECVANVYEYATVYGKTQISDYETNGWKLNALKADKYGASVIDIILNRQKEKAS